MDSRAVTRGYVAVTGRLWEVDLPQNRGESGIGLEAVELGVDTQPDEMVIVLLDRPLQGTDRLIRIAQGKVGGGDAYPTGRRFGLRQEPKGFGAVTHARFDFRRKTSGAMHLSERFEFLRGRQG